MSFNPAPMVLRNHQLYRHAQFLDTVKGRTPGLVTGFYDPVTRAYLDECGYNCIFCNGTYEDQVYAAVELDNDSFTHESHHDLRSSAREKNRPRKIHENKSGRCNSYKCRKEHQTWQRRQNKRKNQENLRFAVEESQSVVIRYTLGFTSAKHKAVVWDTRIPEELDQWVSHMDDDLVRYTLFNQNADLFENPELFVEIGEDFSTWCQRRIAEMRSVKEARLRHSAPPTAKPVLWKRSQRHGTAYEVYTGDASTTTLPTNAYDALGHSLLRSILTPPLRATAGYGWFGEYEWAWHRNISGCWDFGHATGCSKVEGDWPHAPLPCPHCCGENAGMFYECYCRDFEGCVAPEEMQRCSLVEWVGDAGRTIIASDDAMKANRARQEECEDKSDVEWDVVSWMSSETWSVVDVEG